MISLAALVPNPPLLVPELTGSTASEQLEALRSACRSAVDHLAESASSWVAVGAHGADFRSFDPTATGTFLGYGVDVRVALGPGQLDGPPDPSLPLPALVAGWLRGQAGSAVTVRAELVPVALAVADCIRFGKELAERCAGPDPVGLLVLGDGSNRHPELGPGTPDERAAAFDEAVRDTVADADAAALLGLDPELAAELGAQGRAAWQVLAACVLAEWPRSRTEVLYSAAPFGVGYHVALWQPADAHPAGG